MTATPSPKGWFRRRGPSSTDAPESLLDIGRRHGTDKAHPERVMLPAYDHHLSEARESSITLVEIGVLDGNSLRMWRDYFPRGNINGVDISPAAARHEDKRHRIRVFIGSQGDADFLEKMIDEIGRPDVVIDDGSHRAQHQITSLLTLWPLVKPGGWYIVEDIHTSYLPEYGMGWRRFGTTVELLKGVADDVNDIWHQGPTTLSECASVSFYAETCVIRKLKIPRVRQSTILGRDNPAPLQVDLD
jgi:hypothetical protein